MTDDLSSHERREHEKKLREEERTRHQELLERKQQTKNHIWIGISLLVFIVFASVLIYLLKSQPKMYTDREVHWHATFDLNICGQRVDLPCLKKTPGIVHGKEFCGVTLLHHHFDNTAHIEGVIPKKEDIMLGKFFDEIGVPFDKDKLLNSTNGDLCDGKPGVLKMYVNGQPRTDFRDYVPLATPDGRKQVIKLVFEPEEGLFANQSQEQPEAEGNVTESADVNETREDNILVTDSENSTAENLS